MIRNLRMYPVFTSKGTPSVKVKVFTDDGIYSASVPSGTSKGKYEAVELPVSRVLRFFSKVRPMFIGQDETDWEGIDNALEKMDGTPDFRRIGENLALALSIAIARAAKKSDLWKLGNPGLAADFPIPVGNVIGGGAHGGGSDWQEFLLIPHRAKNPYEAIEHLTNVWIQIAQELKSKGKLKGRNIENAWMADLDNEKTLDMLSTFAHDWGMRIGIDFASSQFWNKRSYVYKKSGEKYSSAKHLEYIENLVKSYKIFYLEDPFHENDYKNHKVLTHILSGKALVVGDDLYCTNRKRLEDGVKKKATNSLIVKPNQTGTVSRTRAVVELARKSGIAIIPSHRSGETDDDWLADLAIAWDAPLIKAGITGLDAPKLNRLMELWEEIPKVRMASLPV